MIFVSIFKMLRKKKQDVLVLLASQHKQKRLDKHCLASTENHTNTRKKNIFHVPTKGEGFSRRFGKCKTRIGYIKSVIHKRTEIWHQLFCFCFVCLFFIHKNCKSLLHTRSLTKVIILDWLVSLGVCLFCSPGKWRASFYGLPPFLPLSLYLYCFTTARHNSV